MPEERGLKVKTFKIDGQDVTAREDETVLGVCRENNIFLPTMCHLDGLSDIGACRLCLVEVKGISKLLPACTTHPEEGWEIFTASERLANYRRTLVEFLFSEGNHICSVCVSNGHCDLQWLANRLNIDHLRVPYLNQKFDTDASHARFYIDHNRCVLCTRCVRVCDEVEGAHTWDVMDRGIDSRVITDMNAPWGISDTCTSCGKCVQVCPTGALVEKGRAVAEMTKKRDFLVYLAQIREAQR